MRLFFSCIIKLMIAVIFISTGFSVVTADTKIDLFEKLLAYHQYKRPPSSDDWLSHHPEPGQTFADYIKENPTVPDEIRQIIYIALLGSFDKTREKIIKQTVKYMEAYFGKEIRFIDPIPLSVIPESAKRNHPFWHDPQILTTYVIEDVLKPKLPDDAFCLIAFTASDLWPGEGWNFVFGQASIENRLGVWSIYRNGIPSKSEEDYKLCLLRTIKTGTHEVGHMFGLQHCIFFECNMNGSNHLGESDQRPVWLCPVCLKKLQWAGHFDVMDRYKRLEKLSGKLGFNKEAAFFRQIIRDDITQ